MFSSIYLILCSNLCIHIYTFWNLFVWFIDFFLFYGYQFYKINERSLHYEKSIADSFLVTHNNVFSDFPLYYYHFVGVSY